MGKPHYCPLFLPKTPHLTNKNCRAYKFEKKKSIFSRQFNLSIFSPTRYKLWLKQQL